MRLAAQRTLPQPSPEWGGVDHHWCWPPCPPILGESVGRPQNWGETAAVPPALGGRGAEMEVQTPLPASYLPDVGKDEPNLGGGKASQVWGGREAAMIHYLNIYRI